MEHEPRDGPHDIGELEDQDSDAPLSTGNESLEDLRAQRDEYLSLLKRAQADYKNLRRRGLADLDAGVRRSLQPLLESLLLVLDHLDMALTTPTRSEDAKSLAVGVQMTRDQLVAALEREDVREIDSKGAFDAERHQAVATVESDDARATGSIVDTIRKGYTWRDNVLRPAQVCVATRAAGNVAPKGSPAEDVDRAGTENIEEE